MRKLRVITNSELRTRRRCAREHHLSYELGYRTVRDAEPLYFGRALHLALEAWWRCPDLDRRFAWALSAVESFDLDPYTRQRLEQMLAGYDVRWANEPLELAYLPATGEPCVEVEFRAPLVNPYTGKPSRTFEVGGKLDAIVRQTDTGKAFILEHKSTSENIAGGTVYWERLRMDSQISLYYYGARALGFDVAGTIYDVLHKPALRPLLATPPETRRYTRNGALYASQRELDETPNQYGQRIAEAIASKMDDYYARGTIVRFDSEAAEAIWDVWQDARAIREAELTQRWPRNPDACERYGRMCPFWDVCTGVATLEDESLYRKAETTHEELFA